VGGNTALALLLVIATNLGGIFTMPVRALSPPLDWHVAISCRPVQTLDKCCLHAAGSVGRTGGGGTPLDLDW
jgi:hypothetical protein